MTYSRLRSLPLAASLFVFAGCNPPPKPEPTPAPKPSPTPAPKGEAPSITPAANEAPESHAWTTDQILTCSVSQCRQLANKNEETFFDIVQQLAAISAKNRDITLPQEAAGGKAGEYIKTQAKGDRGQLLFAIVDAAPEGRDTRDRAQ